VKGSLEGKARVSKEGKLGDDRGFLKGGGRKREKRERKRPVNIYLMRAYRGKETMASSRVW